MKAGKAILLISCTLIFMACSKKDQSESFDLSAFDLNSIGFDDSVYYAQRSIGFISVSSSIKLKFSAPLNTGSTSSSVIFKDKEGRDVGFIVKAEDKDSSIVIVPLNPLSPLSIYNLKVTSSLRSKFDQKLTSSIDLDFHTKIDTTDKFERISEESLITLVQRQTFKYFWDFGHPVSGMARERDSSGDIVTTGGTGFGVMAIITAIHRGFVTREEGLARIQKITTFLKNKAHRFHGAFPHWLNGNTGAVQPFSTKDNGADLVETSLLMQGLLTARQYFNGAGQEADLRNEINSLWNAVEWSWFRKDNANVLYWHWSPDYNWDMNLPVRGWNEALITYVLAASSPSHAISKAVYDNGWANNSTFRNGNTYFGVQLPLGPAMGGPLFFSHYSFMGINPLGLSDTYANYETQNKAHAQINYQYCKSNPKGFYGYGSDCWGLTASDDINGYKAHEPTNDNGVISPTAALSSFPYTPEESMKALKFFYYKLGDKVWKEYGFVDAFSLHEPWFASSFLAIDQGPIIVMIENYRSGLLWNLFMSCPEVKTGMRTLGFSSPRL